MAINIYTSRIVLDALGVNDYGIYNVVGGFVAMLSMFVNSLSASSQRFFAYEMGQSSPQLPRIFSATISVHVLITLVIILFFESFGLWFLNCKMNIPLERVDATYLVYQCSVFAFAINMISIPYLASIIAHEKMGAFAFISVFEACLKLGLAYFLLISLSDKLIIYAIGMLFISIMLRFIYGWYCHANFSECNFHFLYDKILYKRLLSFTGWNAFGASAGILNTYGINILVNIFFGVSINAARGIADQVSNAVSSFAGNFTMAMTPQIAKSYSSGNFSYTSFLVYRGAKYSALLLWILSLPLILQGDFILDLWLIKVPYFASIFVKLALLYAMCHALSLTLYYGVLATGEIKAYHIVVTVINLIAFPICYVSFRFNKGPEWGYISAIIAMILSLIGRAVMLARKLTSFSVFEYIKNTLLRVSLVVILSYIIMIPFGQLPISSKYANFFLIVLISIFVNLGVIFLTGLDKNERKTLCSLILSKVFHGKKE